MNNVIERNIFLILFGYCIPVLITAFLFQPKKNRVSMPLQYMFLLLFRQVLVSNFTASVFCF